MRWEWSDRKNGVNKKKHKMPFEVAIGVFDDPFAITRRDIYPYEERLQTVGMIGNRLVLVIHTMPIFDVITNEEVGRIISARKPTIQERRSYEEGEF